MHKPRITLVSRFPPPVDGQTVAAMRLSELLAPYFLLDKVHLSYTRGELISRETLFSRGLRVMAAVDSAKAEINRHPGGIVLYNGLSSTVLGHLRDVLFVRYAVPRNRPLWGILHNGNYDRIFRPSLSWYSARWLANRLQLFVCLSPSLASRLYPYVGPEKVVVIPNTIDDEILCSVSEFSCRRHRLTSEDALRVVFISNMHKAKGFLDVLDAAKVLARKGVNLQVDFIGAWPSHRLEALFYEKLGSSGLRGIVNHHGPVYDRLRMKEILLEADAFVLPTYYPFEAQPITIIEALNAGTPVVTTRVAGIADMITEEHNGLFVEPRDAADLARQLDKLRQPDLWESLSLGARESFMSRFHPEIVRRQWLELSAAQACA